MPTGTTFSVISLGQLSVQIDPTEGSRNVPDFDAENAQQLVGRTFSGFVNDSVQTFSPVVNGNGQPTYATTNDGGGSVDQLLTYNQDNSRGSDVFNITDDNGAVVQHTFDALVQYRGVVTFSDGTTANVPLNIIQDTAGNAWIVPPSIRTPTAALLGDKPITSIRLTGVNNNTYSGLLAEREMLQIVTVPCFAAGTLIRTPAGDVPVETLKTGDLVMTRDHDALPIRWLGSRRLGGAALAAAPHLRPIRIAAGALGENLPAQDLRVSPQHRVLVRSRIAQRMFDTDEVLIAAKSLVMLEGIDIDADADQVEYFHLMFDQHEIVFSNGAETESFYAGAEALKGIGAAAQDELFSLFPELRDEAMPEPARPMLSGRMGRKLTMRHAQNRKPLQLS